MSLTENSLHQDQDDHQKKGNGRNFTHPRVGAWVGVVFGSYVLFSLEFCHSQVSNCLYKQNHRVIKMIIIK